MCGIIGITSSKPVSSSILHSLKKLEYRGYDSAGIATIDNGIINEIKSLGRVDVLEKNISQINLSGEVGIGHVRWATHGMPSTINAHPHSTENISVVHNGIIENSVILKKSLINKGHKFKSETDTEVIVHLLSEYLKSNELNNAIIKTLNDLDGSFALGIIFKDMPNIIVGARRGSPLAVGYGPNENYLGSDSYALKSMTNKITYLNDGEFCIIKKDEINFYDYLGNKINKKILQLSTNEQNYEKGEYKHFMAKEINEQPLTIKNCVNEYIDKINNEINLHNFPWKKENIKSVKLIGCGTAFHSCLIGKYWFEELTNLDVDIDIASEFRYRKNRFKEDCLYIFVSQSGETADTYAALDLCKKNKMKTCSIVNVVESSIARDSDFVLPIHCGPEIGVASTKAFVTQLACLNLLLLTMMKLKKQPKKAIQNISSSLLQLPKKINKTFDMLKVYKDVAKLLFNKNSALFLGRGMYFPIAREGALKLKEISYIHAEAYPAGELKHGPLALIDKDMPVLALVPDNEHLDKIQSNIQEVAARKGRVITIGPLGKTKIGKNGGHIKIPKTLDLHNPIISVVPMQLISYYTALLKGTDVDKPRNLAKSVTVE